MIKMEGQSWKLMHGQFTAQLHPKQLLSRFLASLQHFDLEACHSAMASPEDLEQIRQYIRVLKNPKADDDEKRQVADELGYLVYGHEENQLAFEAEGGLPPLVQLLRDGGDRAKVEAILALHTLAEDNAQVAKAIVACGGRKALEVLAKDPKDDEDAKSRREKAQDALKLLPAEPAEPAVEAKSTEQKASSPEDFEKIRRHVRVLKLDADEANYREKGMAAISLGDLASTTNNRLAIEAQGAVPRLVDLLRDGDRDGEDEPKCYAAYALLGLADNAQVAKAIVDCKGWEALEALAEDPKDGEEMRQGKDYAQKALKLLTRGSGLSKVQVKVKALDSDDAEEQCKAAERLANWAAASDEKRDEINNAGGCEALVATVVNGSDDAKWHAARALRNLANHAEAKQNILKADGIAVLTPLAKHGKGKVKEAASEALNLLSLPERRVRPARAADTKPAA